ncbi:MAG: sulfite exporter TauE/SafE family protein [Ignavibacteriaceae bacterium]|jgi:hypothetical protein|nr:sulfite exporter TauE/SafE family protein [Ignavibacteriaceae bacterium]MCW9066038.1 sulfite exporter TauE/SafE family protein [Ignavibacteriaceae bacterium]
MNVFIYLPVAGISVSVFLLLGLGLGVGFLSGLFGVGGGFLLTPLLIMIGIPPTVAAASDSNQIVAASTSGTLAHGRRGNVDFKMGFYLLIGGVIGGTLGVQLIKLLRETGNADFVIKLTYILMLGIIGTYMFQESLRNLRMPRIKMRKISRTKISGAEEKKPSILFKLYQSLPFQTRFEKSGVTISVITPVFLGILVGILAAIMGVGGGFIMVPVMVYMLRMPMHVVVGTSLFQILITCINVTFMQAYYNQTVDIVLALLLLLGSTIGAQLGAKVSDRLNADQMKVILAAMVLFVMVQMVYGVVVHPDMLFSVGGGH